MANSNHDNRHDQGNWRAIGAWTLATVVASLLVCAAIAAMHMSSVETLRRATEFVAELRQARLDLHQGMLDVRVASLTQSRQQSERGERLLARALDEFERALVDQPERAVDLRSLHARFVTAIERSILPGAGRDELVGLLATFDAIQEYAARLDSESLGALAAMSRRQNTIFGAALLASILLLGAMSASTIWSARQRRIDIATINEGEERFRRFFEMAPMPIAYVDRLGNVLAVNRQFVERFGYTHAEVPTVGEWRRRAYPDQAYREEVARLRADRLARVASSGGPASTEFRVTCKDGRVLDVVVTSTPLENGNLNTFMDVTESRRAELEIRKSEDRFRSFFELSPLPISYVDRHGNVFAVNRQFVETFGYEFKEVPTVEDFRQRVYPEAAYREKASELHRELYAKVAATGGSASAEFHITCKDGIVRDVIVTVTPLGDGFLNTFQDTTERRAAERAIGESERRFRQLFDESPLPKAFIGIDGTVIAINRQLTEVLGYTLEEVPTVAAWLERAYPDPVYREGNRRLWIEKAAHVAEGDSIDFGERHVVCKDGSDRHLQISGTAVSGGIILAMVDVTERKRAELTLRRQIETTELARRDAEGARATLTAAISAMSEPFVVVDRNRRFVHLNLAYAKGQGFARIEDCPPGLDDLPPRGLIRLDDGREIAADERPINRALRGETCLDLEYRRILEGVADFRYVNISAAPIRDASGAIVGAVQLARNITQRRQAENDLRAEKEKAEAARADAERVLKRLEAALGAMADPVAIFGVDRRFIHINTAFAKAQNYPDVASCPTSIDALPPTRELFDADGREVAPKDWPISRALRGETCSGVEFRIHRKESNDDWYASISAAPIVDPDGTIVGGVMVGRDITQRHKSDVALREEKESAEAARADAERMHGRLEAALSAMSSSVLIADAQGRFVHFNDAFVRYHRFKDRSECPPNHTGYMPFVEMFEPDGTWVESARRPIMRALAGETGIDMEFHLRRRDTGEKWIGRYNFAPIRSRDRAIAGAVVSATDITDRKQAEAKLHDSQEQLAQAQKMEAVGQLTGGIAHDFNNLLAIIIGNLELLRPEIADAPGEMADTALRAATRGAELTRRLLAFSRRQTLQPRKIDLNDLVAGVANLFRRTLGENIRIETRLAADVDGITADPGQLEGALLNLAVNARDAMPQGGTLTISTGRADLDDAFVQAHKDVVPGRYETVSVTDTGTGMAADVAARAFEPFFTTKEVGKGTGLGLSMVYGFAKQSGGHAAVASEPGKGTTVTIYLPCTPTQPIAKAGDADGRGARRGAGERILVAEDDPDVRALVCQQLAAFGYEVEPARDGLQALELISRGAAPALLLTDIVMPGGVGGIAVAAAARKAHPGLPVVFMSGHPLNDETRARIEDEQAPFLQKPFTQSQLADAVARSLGKKGS